MSENPIQEVYNAVRREDVVLFAGAGMSISAGFPSGNELSQELFSLLTKDERLEIGQHTSLTAIAESISNIRGDRKLIMKVLKRYFNKKVPFSEVHSLVSKIPHIRTIVTTNYDRLFESAFGEHASVLYSSSDIPRIESKRKEIFKIHGDLSKPDDIVITETDYRKFFVDKTEENIYWSVVKERMFTKTLVIMGYGVSDFNTLVVFDKVRKELGDRAKRVFVVAPNFKKSEIARLNRMNFIYINDTAEHFIKSLFDHLKRNILDDLEKGVVSLDTYKEFLELNGLRSDLKAKPQGYDVGNIIGINGSIEGELFFGMPENPEALRILNEYLKGEKLDEFSFKQLGISLHNITLNGISLYPTDDGIVDVKIKRQPGYTGTLVIRLEDGEELENVRIEMTSVGKRLHITAQMGSMSVTITSEGDYIGSPENVSFNISYRPPAECKSLKEDLKAFEFIRRLSLGQKFSAFYGGEFLFTRDFQKSPELEQWIGGYVEIMNDLKRIEQFYNVRFSYFLFEEFGSEKFRCNLAILLSVINNSPIEIVWDSAMEIYYKEDQRELLLHQQFSETLLTITHRDGVLKEFSLLGRTIQLVETEFKIVEPYLENIEEIEKRVADSVVIKSAKSIRLVKFEKPKEDEK